MARSVPQGWLSVSKCGKPIPRTKFLPFKVPLKEITCENYVSLDDWFTPEILLKLYPNLRLIINLTQVSDGRYYNYSDFIRNGIQVKSMEVPGGGSLPPKHFLEKFFDVVDDFSHYFKFDSDGLIGVHCTHGVNRTGYFICKYLTRTFNMRGEHAIELFENARGEKIERENYKMDIILD